MFLCLLLKFSNLARQCLQVILESIVLLLDLWLATAGDQTDVVCTHGGERTLGRRFGLGALDFVLEEDMGG